MSDEVTYIGFEDLRMLAGRDNDDMDGVSLPDSFEQYDVSYEALGQFGLQGALQYLEGVDVGGVDPLQALMGMWFGGAKLGLLIRDEQRRRVVDEMGSLETPDSPPEEK